MKGSKERQPGLCSRRLFLEGTVAAAFTMLLGGDNRVSRDSASSVIPQQTRGAAAAVLAPESSESLQLGPYTILFDSSLDAKTQQRMRQLLERAFPVVSKHVVMSGNENPDNRIIFKEVDGEGGTSFTDPLGGMVRLARNRNEGVEVHEFIHALRGKGASKFYWLEEGIAVGVTRLAVAELGIEPDIYAEQLDVSRNLYNGGMALNGTLPLNVYSPLSTPRLRLAGDLWRDIEAAAPGCFKRLQDAVSPHGDDFAQQVRVVKEFFAREGIMDSIILKNPLMRRMDVYDKPRIFSYYLDTGGFRYILLYLIQKSKQRGGVESSVGGHTLEYRFINQSDGNVSKWESVQTNAGPDMAHQIALFDDRVGNHKLHDIVGQGSRYKLEIRCSELGISDELGFDYSGN